MSDNLQVTGPQLFHARRRPELISIRQGKEHAKEVPELLGTTENELGIRKWLEDQGHTLVTTSDKEGENSTFDKELVDAEVIITTPYAAPFSSLAPSNIRRKASFS